MGNQGVLAALQAQRDAVAAEEKAVDRDYPKYVTPDPAAWKRAQTVEERNAAKVLVHNEAEHRLAAPHDFAAPAPSDEGGEGKKGKK